MVALALSFSPVLVHQAAEAAAAAAARDKADAEAALAKETAEKEVS